MKLGTSALVCRIRCIYSICFTFVFVFLCIQPSKRHGCDKRSLGCWCGLPSWRLLYMPGSLQSWSVIWFLYIIWPCYNEITLNTYDKKCFLSVPRLTKVCGGRLICFLSFLFLFRTFPQILASVDLQFRQECICWPGVRLDLWCWWVFDYYIVFCYDDSMIKLVTCQLFTIHYAFLSHII